MTASKVMVIVSSGKKKRKRTGNEYSVNTNSTWTLVSFENISCQYLIKLLLQASVLPYQCWSGLWFATIPGGKSTESEMKPEMLMLSLCWRSKSGREGHGSLVEASSLGVIHHFMKRIHDLSLGLQRISTPDLAPSNVACRPTALASL